MRGAQWTDGRVNVMPSAAGGGEWMRLQNDRQTACSGLLLRRPSLRATRRHTTTKRASVRRQKSIRIRGSDTDHEKSIRRCQSAIPSQQRKTNTQTLQQLTRFFGLFDIMFVGDQ